MILLKKQNSLNYKKKIPDVSNLATKTALTTVENKIPSVSNLVKKTDYNTKVTEIEDKLNNHHHDKYIDTQEFNKLTADAFNARLAQANLITKTEFHAKMSILNIKITASKSKHFLFENGLNKLITFDSSYFTGKSHFDEDGAQNYLVFQPIHKYFEFVNINSEWYITSWKSKGLSEESIKPVVTSDNTLNPLIDYYYYSNKMRLKFKESCLKQHNLHYKHKNIINIYIVHELGASSSNNSDPTLKRLFIWYRYFD